MEWDYPSGWIKKQSHTQKSHTKTGNAEEEEWFYTYTWQNGSELATDTVKKLRIDKGVMLLK